MSLKAVFVFGSNLAGRHGAGSAKRAVEYYGAIYGQGIGRQGNSYAIPTKDGNLKTLDLTTIAEQVGAFLRYAKLHEDEEFFLTNIGCGLAGYTPGQIAPMFRDAPSNIILSKEFKEILGRV